MDRLLDRDWDKPVRYPDPAIEVLDKRFSNYIFNLFYGFFPITTTWSSVSIK